MRLSLRHGTNMTLNIDELQFDPPKGWKEDGKTPCNTFKSKYEDDVKNGKKGNVAEWRMHYKDVNNAEGISLGKPDILQFNPSYNGHYPLPDGGWKPDKYDARNSLFFLKKDDVSVYPGFYKPDKHPLGIYTPSCFKTGTRVKEALQKNQADIKTHTYIQSWGHFLDKDRMGLLPPKLSMWLNDIECKTGNISIISKPQFIRRGVSSPGTPNDNFLELLLKEKV